MVLAAGLASSALAAIDSVTRLVACPTQYAKTEFQVMLRADWKDPTDPQDVSLDLELRDPDGQSLSYPAFLWAGESGQPSEWRLRMSPTRPGEYTGHFLLHSRDGETHSGPVRFSVQPSRSHGFLRPNNPWSFRYDDGTLFRGLGENLCWESRKQDDSRFFGRLQEHPRFNYEYMLGCLAAQGGNFFRTWICSWNLPLDWKQPRNTLRYPADEARFNRSAMRRLDELVELSSALGLHLMLTLDTGGSFHGAEWELSPYNRRNGGPVATPREFFESPEARALYRNRLRLIVARWSYSPAIACWEFFNEVDNLMHASSPAIPDALVTDWHREMAGYLRRTDPHHHMVTTSRSHREVAGLDELADLDFSQHHMYGHTGDIPGELARRSARNAKPHVIGEFGYEWDWNKNFDAFADRMDRDFELGLWLGLLSETPILPMSWWWEYFSERGTDARLAPVRKVLDEMLAQGGPVTALDCRVEGAQQGCRALRCGDTAYLCVWTELAQPAQVDVSLPAGTLQRGSTLSRLDSATGTWGPEVVLEKVTGTLPLSLGPTGMLVVRLGSVGR